MQSVPNRYGFLSRRVWLCLLGLVLEGVLPLASNAADKFEDLLKRIPDHCNAIALIDVDALLDSPLGKREQWREKMVDRPSGVLGASANASKVVMSASVDTRTMQDRWKLGMVQTRGAAPSLSVLASREGGYLDQVETQSVVWTPRGMYLVRFDPRIVGFVAPADRQGLTSWITNTLSKPRNFPSGWYDRAVFRANAGSDIVVALNLKNAVSPVEIEAWARSLEDVKKYRLDPSLLASKLSGVKSATYQIDVDETIKGSLRVDFDGDISYAAPMAKEIVTAALSGAGAESDYLSTWQASVEGNAITLSGRMEEDDVIRITRFLTIPHLDSMDDKYASANESTASVATATKPAEATESDVVKASQQYFHSVVNLVSKLKTQKNQSFNTIRIWLDRTAGDIDELPILSVDTDLLEWGSRVSYLLREMAFGVNYSNKSRQYQLANSNKGGYGGYYYGGGAGASVDDRLAKTSSNAVLSVDLEGRWRSIQNSIGETRRALVAKYKVEF